MWETKNGVLRGAQKQMLVLETRDSRCFSEAFFILRENVSSKEASKESIVREANRILEESTLLPGRRKKPLGAGWSFFIGCLCGVVLAFGFFLLFLT